MINVLCRKKKLLKVFFSRLKLQSNKIITFKITITLKNQELISFKNGHCWKQIL